MIDFKTYIIHQLNEMKRELLDALDGLSADDMNSHEPCGHWPVAWIAEHCSDVVDHSLYAPVKGRPFLEHDPVIVNWPKEEPKPGYPYLARDEIARRWKTLCEAVVVVVRGLPESELQETHGGKEIYVESCLKAINHTNAHLRSLWCILGERRLDEKFPEQGSWLA